MRKFRHVVVRPLLLTLVACAIAFSSVVSGNEPAVEIAEVVATQKIEYLRRQYARATDLIGLNTEASIAEGRDIYRRIFTADVKISVVVDGEVLFTAEGPDAWVQVAADALREFDNTQHLIGTQLVDIHSMPNGQGVGGEAEMSSYLQAWHDDPDRVLDIFIGTYNDKVRYDPDQGWQIYEMQLWKVSGSIKDLTKP